MENYINLSDVRRILESKHFELQEEIGNGGQGMCFVVFSNLYNTQFVCKCMHIVDSDREKSVKQQFDQEISSLSNIIHKNIVKIYDFFSEDNYLFMIIEYCSQGNLASYIKKQRPVLHLPPKLDYTTIRKYMVDILSALVYCHEDSHISHHDIKPQNIVIDQFGNAKLCDFGLSHKITTHLSSLVDPQQEMPGKRKKQDIGGSLYFMSPQLLYCSFHNDETYDFFSADIWAFGVTFYSCLTLKYPFIGHSRMDIYRQQKLAYSQADCFDTDELEFLNEIPKDTPPDIVEALKRCFIFDEVKRATAKELLEILWPEYYQPKKLRAFQTLESKLSPGSFSNEFSVPLFQCHTRESKKMSITSSICTKSLSSLKKKRLIFKPKVAAKETPVPQ